MGKTPATGRRGNNRKKRREGWGVGRDENTYMCLLTNSPTSPACGANRLDTPSSKASATSSLCWPSFSFASSKAVAWGGPSGRNPTPLRSLAFRAFRRRSASATDSPRSVSEVSSFSRAASLSFVWADGAAVWVVAVSDVVVAAAVGGSAVVVVVVVVFEAAFESSSSLLASARCLNCFRFLLGRNTTCGSALVSAADVESMMAGSGCASVFDGEGGYVGTSVVVTSDSVVGSDGAVEISLSYRMD